MDGPPNRGDYLRLIDKRPKAQDKLGWWTSQTFSFDELFLKKMWNRASDLGYFTQPVKNGEKKLHVIIFRRFLERFHDLLDEKTPNINAEDFGAASSSTHLNWDDLRRVFEKDDEGSRFPQIKLKFAEQCNFVFAGQCNSLFDSSLQGQGQGESYLSWTVGIIILLAIILNVVQILGLVGESVGNLCALIFSVEYLCKLSVSPFCRYSIFNEDWLLEKVVPDPKDAEAVLPAGMTPGARLARFVFTPMNVIDLLSILPTWIEMVLSETGGGVNLQFLRALRLFRLFRILKFGKFSSTLTVLGVTVFNSIQAICVLCLYIVMISMLAGAVIQQFEEKSEDEELQKAFSSVPMAMKWVAGRMVAMQHSLPEKKALPQHLVSAFIVIFLGLFKGVIFVLPIATITQAYTEANKANVKQQAMTKAVEEDRMTPLGTEWCKDHTAPTARIEVRKEGKGDTPCGTGWVKLPFYTQGKDRLESDFWVPLVGSLKGMCSGHPGVQVTMVWQPDADSKPKEKLPKGELTVKEIKGANFKSEAGASWICVVEVQVKLYPVEVGGKDHILRCEYKQSGGDASSPEFDSTHRFTVRWEVAGQKERGDDEWQRQVLELLDQQGEKLEALEAKVKNK
jgi:hypothetical protein